MFKEAGCVSSTGCETKGGDLDSTLDVSSLPALT